MLTLQETVSDLQAEKDKIDKVKTKSKGFMES